MKANVGSRDAAVRFVVGGVLLLLANHGQRWGLAGFALVITAAGFCPFCRLLRIDTAAGERAQAGPGLRLTRAPDLRSAPPRTHRAAGRARPVRSVPASAATRAATDER